MYRNTSSYMRREYWTIPTLDVKLVVKQIYIFVQFSHVNIPLLFWNNFVKHYKELNGQFEWRKKRKLNRFGKFFAVNVSSKYELDAKNIRCIKSKGQRILLYTSS